MPIRADIADVDAAEWKAQGNQRPRDHQNAIDLLQPGDVFVVDVFGSVAAGGIIGDNLAYYIMKTPRPGSSSMAPSATWKASRPSIWRLLQGRGATRHPQRHGDGDQHSGPHRQRHRHAGDVVFGDNEACRSSPRTWSSQSSTRRKSPTFTTSGRKRSSTRASTSRRRFTPGRGIPRCSRNTRTT